MLRRFSPARSSRRLAAVAGLMLGIAAVSQLVAAQQPRPSAAAPVVVAGPGLDSGLAGSDAISPAAADLDRIRADATFWGGRLRAAPRDFVSATELAAAEIELARATGDLNAWLAADVATGQALASNPGYGPAVGYRGTALLALHRFVEARDLARSVLADKPSSPFALATLGDAELSLGGYRDARAAYEQLDRGARSAATLIRLARLSYTEGSPSAAVTNAQRAADAAIAEGAGGERLAWYQCQLGDLLASTGNREASRTAFAACVDADSRSWLARVGLARLDAAAGRLDDAIRLLGEAIAIVPMPDSLARRSDLFELRGAAGDARRAADDRATVEAIARLAGANGVVYDRTLALYLANHGLDPERAVRLAAKELTVRADVDGYDTSAWALLAAGRPADADAAMRKALALGTRDARLLYHAGMIAAALGDTPRARALLGQAIELDPSFDPLQVARARVTLESLR